MRRLNMYCAFFLLLLALALPAIGCAKEAPAQVDLNTYADQLLANAYLQQSPGAVVAVMRGDEIIYRGAHGLASVELNLPLDANQVFRIGSVTKQYAAAAILALVDEGKIGLDDPLTKFLPDYPNGNNITILQLLNHTSGVKSYTSIKGIMAGPIRLDVSTAELIDSFKHLPVDFAPGTQWAYNNSGYVLLGAVLEKVSGSAWHTYIKQTFFEPHKLKTTQFGGDDQLIRGMASGYTLNEGNLAPANYLSMTQPHAGGALVSSPEDMLRWNRILHGGKLLSADTYQAMITPQGKATAENYGFGIKRRQFRDQTMLEHGGGIPGFSTYLLYLPESQIGVAVIQNADVALGKISHSHIALRIAAFALGKPFPEAVVIDIGEKALHSLEGVYRIDDQSTRELRVVNGALTSKRSGGSPYPLISIGNDRFLFQNGIDQLKIVRHSDGRVNGMQLTFEGGDEGSIAKLTDEPLSKPRVALENLSIAQKQRILGNYRGAPGLLRMAMNSDGKVTAQLEGQQAFDAFAQTPDLYFLTVADATLDFAAGEPAPKVTLNQGGKSTVLERAEN